MPVRVELIDEAISDLARYASSGNLALFLKKLLRLEEVGEDAGLPLGRGLTGWRKIIVGDRDWRIVFTTNSDDTTATVWVIGDRSDAACYEEAGRRIAAYGTGQPHVASLAAAILQVTEIARTRRGTKTKRSR